MLDNMRKRLSYVDLIIHTECLAIKVLGNIGDKFANVSELYFASLERLAHENVPLVNVLLLTRSMKDSSYF